MYQKEYTAFARPHVIERSPTLIQHGYRNTFTKYNAVEIVHNLAAI